MSFLNSNPMKSWANEWNFFHSPQKPLQYANEWIAGMRDQRLVKVAWGGEKGRRLYIIVRFAGTTTSGSLRESLRQDPSLAALPGWKKLKPAPEAKPAPAGVGRPDAPGADYERPGFRMNALVHHDLVVDEKSIIWCHAFSWSRPNAAKLRSWVEALLASLSRTTRGFDDRCELCESGRTHGYMLFEGLPMMICPGCRERIRLEGQMAEQRYEQEDANVALGLVGAAAGAAIGGAVWAAVAILTNRILVAVAIGIGMLVAFAYKLCARKLDRVGQVAGALFTIAGVLLGQVLFYAWHVAQARPDIGFRLDAGGWVLLGVLRDTPGDVVLPLVFGIVGAIVAINFLRKPRFAPRVESPEEAVEHKKAA